MKKLFFLLLTAASLLFSLNATAQMTSYDRYMNRVSGRSIGGFMGGGFGYYNSLPIPDPISHGNFLGVNTNFLSTGNFYKVSPSVSRNPDTKPDPQLKNYLHTIAILRVLIQQNSTERVALINKLRSEGATEAELFHFPSKEKFPRLVQLNIWIKNEKAALEDLKDKAGIFGQPD